MSLLHTFLIDTVVVTENNKCKQVTYKVQGVDVDTAIRNFFDLEMGEVFWEGPESDAVWTGISLAQDEETGSESESIV